MFQDFSTTHHGLAVVVRRSFEEDVKSDGSSEQRSYIAGPHGTVAVHTVNAASPGGSLTYWHRDHLGSLTVTTNQSGAVVDRMRYDPWGKPMTSQAGRAGTGDRGFTGHEHLAGGLIHMNGRIYDPVLGRFLSADIVVQAPGHIVSYNRYAYVMNNPLAYTDPSGYFIQFIPLIIAALQAAAPYIMMTAIVGSGVAMATGHETAAMRILFGGIFLATAGFLPGPGVAITGNSLLAVVGSGFAMGGLQSGSIEGAIAGAVQAVATLGVGQLADIFAGIQGLGDLAKVFNEGGIGRAGMHALVGCGMSVSQGGKCGPSAAAAGFSSLAGAAIPASAGPIGHFFASAVIGGVASVLGGGKFKNGAFTAAFTWMFNCGAHDCWQHAKEEVDTRALTMVDISQGAPMGGNPMSREAFGMVALGAGAGAAAIGGAFVLSGTAAMTGPEAASLVANVARAEYAKGATYLVQTYLNAAEQAAYYAAGPGLQAAFVGTAVHRATAQYLDKYFTGLFQYFARGPDFLFKPTAQQIELTTSRAIASHAARPGYQNATIVTYK